MVVIIIWKKPKFKEQFIILTTHHNDIIIYVIRFPDVMDFYKNMEFYFIIYYVIDDVKYLLSISSVIKLFGWRIFVFGGLEIFC